MSYKYIKPEPTKMSTRGQIVIPQEIRKELSLKKDNLFIVAALDKDTIILKKIDKEKLIREFLNIRNEILDRTGDLTTDEINEEIKHARKKN